MLIRETINAVDGLDIDAATREKIYGGNLERLLKLA
jgi:predicted TIM-barrel fold metal-dependent hydrolase